MENYAKLEKFKLKVIPYWEEYHSNYSISNFNKIKEMPPIPSAFMCRHSTLLLKRVLKSLGDDSWNVRGGWMYINPNNMNNKIKSMSTSIETDSVGDKIHHYWLENDIMVLDITADQVGHENIVYTEKEKVSHIYESLPESSKNSLLYSMSNTVNNWMATLDISDLKGWETQYTKVNNHKNII